MSATEHKASNLRTTLHRLWHPKQWRTSAKPTDTKGKGKAVDPLTIPLSDLPDIPHGTLNGLLNPKHSVNLSFGEKDRCMIKRTRPGLPSILTVPEDKASGRKKGSYELRFDELPLKLGSYMQARGHADQFSVELHPETRVASLVKKV